MSDRELSNHRQAKAIPLLTSAIGAAAVIIASVIGVDAKHDRENAAAALAAKESLIRGLEQKLQYCSKPSRDASPAAQPTGPGPQKAPSELSRTPGVTIVQQEGFSIELQSCSLQGDELDCKLLATAQGEDKFLKLYSWSRLVESDGNEMLASRIQLGRDEAIGQSQAVGAELVRGVPVKMNVRFAGLNLAVSSKKIPLIELIFSGLKAQFKNISVS